RVDFENAIIRLDITKNGKRRDIPINQKLSIILKKWKEENFKKIEVFEFKDIKKSFTTSLSKAGIKNFRFHDLRHTFASHLVMQGVDIATVSQLLGHSSLQMTMRYAHLSPDHRKLAVEKISQFFS
ncbi:MAG: site-specific integrase, partial [Candidatus Omnitrophota bacterium]